MKTLLKKTVLTLAGLSLVCTVKATVITVNVQNYSFTPSSFSASVGDTVKWVWVNGTHTTTSTSVPAGAATWNSPMNSSSTTFEYKITVAGTYNYWCSIHTTSMEASFTASPLGVPSVAAHSNAFAKIYPNPASHILNVNFNTAPGNDELIITDISGREITKESLKSQDNSIDLSTWKKGVYLYSLENNRTVMKGKFVVQ